VLHNRLGEIAQQYLRKGSKVYIEGSLRTRQWTDQNGQERYSTEIRGDQMQMLDTRQQSNKAAVTLINHVLITTIIKVVVTKIRVITTTKMVMVRAEVLLAVIKVIMLVVHKQEMVLIHQNQHLSLRLPLLI
jgi:hypothetical protein